jgi:hypothetical protein
VAAHEYLGDLHLLVLGAVALGPGTAGAVVERLAGVERPVSPTAASTTLSRLREKKLVTSKLGAARPIRGGRAPRIYTVTPWGFQCLQSSIAPFLLLGKALVLAEKKE